MSFFFDDFFFENFSMTFLKVLRGAFISFVPRHDIRWTQDQNTATLPSGDLRPLSHEYAVVTGEIQSVEFLEKSPPLLFGVAKQGEF